MSSSPCLRRVKKLEEAGVIQGYSAKIDLKKLGFTVSALIFIQLTSKNTYDVSEFENAIMGISGVQSCSVLTGRYDYLLKVVAKSTAKVDWKRLALGLRSLVACTIKTFHQSLRLASTSCQPKPTNNNLYLPRMQMCAARITTIKQSTEEYYDPTTNPNAAQRAAPNRHDAIGETPLADAILDRLLHNAHKVQSEGEPMRKIQSEKNKV